MKTVLSVNINKVALIRNSRGEGLPDLYQFARDCEEFGAEGITVHPRPDERHIRYEDLQVLKDQNSTEFNIEGFPSERFLNKVCEVKPHQCTLVPDKPGVLTSSEGWDTKSNLDVLKPIVERLQDHGIRVSLFLNADVELVKYAKDTGTDRIELYTGDYAKGYAINREGTVNTHIKAAKEAQSLNLGLNAGHDLNLENLRYYKSNIINLSEVSIGHALISDALYFGISNTIQMYKEKLV